MNEVVSYLQIFYLAKKNNSNEKDYKHGDFNNHQFDCKFRDYIYLSTTWALKMFTTFEEKKNDAIG